MSTVVARRKRGGKTRARGGRRPQMGMGRPRYNLSTRATGQPDSITVNLKYPFDTILYSLASQNAAVRWNANGAYDVDPILGSTSMPGFTFYTNGYSYYRVISYTLDVWVANMEAVPVSVYCVSMNTDPGTTGINYQAYSANSRNQMFLLSDSTAQPALNIVHHMRVQDLFGSRQVMTDNQFQGSGSSNPADLVYVGIGAHIAVGNLTNGIFIQGELKMRIRFYDKKMFTN